MIVSKHGLIVCLFACFFAGASTTARGDDPVQAELEIGITNSVLSAISHKDFAQLERIAETYRTEKTRKPNGGWLLNVYYDTFKNLISGPDCEKAFHQYSKIFDEWQAAYPKSPTPIIARGELLTSYAWSIRGNGLAGTVSSAQWKIFNATIRDAVDQLDAAPDFARTDPRWYALSIRLANATGVGKASIKRMALEGIDREPGYYTTYFEVLQSLLPWWGGSYREMDLWVNEATALPKAKEAAGLYALLYWSAKLSMSMADFVRLDIDWLRIKRDTDLILERYPSTANLEFAMNMACGSRNPDEVRLRWAALVNIAPDLGADIDPASHCHWPSDPSRKP